MEGRRGDRLHSRGAIVVMSVSGEVDVMNVDELRERLVEAWSQATPDLVLDLSKVRFIDSAGMRLLLATFVHGSVRPGRKAFGGVSDFVLRLVSMLGMRDYLPIYSNQQVAVAALAAAG
ncbi:STAS domain-containing protein [Herbidospora yilanensis]|uniref:STAS domain-containing protein n=1 Tax=Herbidospora yilanensis TaxID=354426 RepID=UPI0022B6EDD0|nr:STAS domain-containing protein [Herbidospora yilanensis]